MTVKVTEKHQITIPKKIADTLDLKKGAMFDIVVSKNRIELIPLETKEKIFSEDVYEKLDILAMKEKGEEKRVTKKYINNLKKGRAY